MKTKHEQWLRRVELAEKAGEFTTEDEELCRTRDVIRDRDVPLGPDGLPSDAILIEIARQFEHAVENVKDGCCDHVSQLLYEIEQRCKKLRPPDPVAITKEQLEILRHTNRNGRYCESPDHADCQHLVKLGLMEERKTDLCGGGSLYFLTDAGKGWCR